MGWKVYSHPGKAHEVPVVYGNGKEIMVRTVEEHYWTVEDRETDRVWPGPSATQYKSQEEAISQCAWLIKQDKDVDHGD